MNGASLILLDLGTTFQNVYCGSANGDGAVTPDCKSCTLYIMFYFNTYWVEFCVLPSCHTALHYVCIVPLFFLNVLLLIFVWIRSSRLFFFHGLYFQVIVFSHRMLTLDLCLFTVLNL